MEIFLSAETEGMAASRWFELQKIFSAELASINDVHYGKGLSSIAIISIIMRDHFFENGGHLRSLFCNQPSN